jgi:polyhydroxyalkanoate synthesis repressor PhaR
MHTIRRYSNRKLYDLNESHYVTLLDLAVEIRKGDEVLVVDHATGQDITAQTLAQAIYVEELKEPRVSTALLVQAIREGCPKKMSSGSECSKQG